MPFPYFTNGLEYGAIQNPKDSIRELQQAAIDSLWDCTTAMYTIKEQADFGSKVYKDIEVWIDYVVGLGSRGTTNGDDFRQLIFRDINHPTKRGLYYKFDDNTWLTYFTDDYASLSKDIGVRRCNNIMRIVDPMNGSIFSIPCVIDYDMTSPNQQVSSYIITPNNHAIVMVQGNKDTLRLFKLNTRYIFGGRPFKLLAYQNAILDDSIAPMPTLLYLDLYLDEIHAEDDLEHQLAFNGDYQYTLSINAKNMDLLSRTKGELTATVMLNGEEVEREVEWFSSNPQAVIINQKGQYRVVGKEGKSTIIAKLKGNNGVSASIDINIVQAEAIQPKIILSPMFNNIRQYETVNFQVTVSYNNKIYNPSTVKISLSPDEELLSNDYLSIASENEQYALICDNLTPDTQYLYITVENTEPQFTATSQFPIFITSIFG